jgi:GNAT superfamily N-acetyltransferase
LILNKWDVVALYDQDQRIQVTYPDNRREVTQHVVRHVPHRPDGDGTIIYSRQDKTNVEAIIIEEIDYFQEAGHDFEWKVYSHDTPPDLKERLAGHGFDIEETEAILVLDIAQAPNFLSQPVTTDVRRITDPAQLGLVRTLEETVWQSDHAWLEHYLGQALTHYPEQMSVYMAYVDDQPASAAWLYFPPSSQFASLWGGSTLAAYRQRGLYSALLAARLQEAQQRGVKFLTVDASPMSQPILEKFGFELIAQAYPCKWHHPSRKG